MVTLLLFWFAPFSDRRGFGTIGHEGVRYLGLGLLAAGAALRVAAVWCLGTQFSPFLEIQDGHHLMISGPYRLVRHPGYLGALAASAGWVLVFESAFGLALWLVLVVPFIIRIKREERLLRSQFPTEHRAYALRTWCLLPFIY
jgi:protein-S-isoprenylcysteine O-methyltransferase Ste14